MRRALLLAPVLLLTACSGGSSPTASVDVDATASPTSSASAPPSPRALGVTTGPATTSAPRVSSPPSTAPRATASSAPLTAKAPGAPAASKATAPGTYTYDRTGTVSYGTPPQTQDASGSSTFVVDPVRDGAQHTAMKGESSGDTTQDLLVRDTGTYLAGLTLTSPAFTKEFRTATAELLVADPARPGAAWRWSVTSTDGKTTATQSTKVLRTETVTVGGTKVPCVVLQTRLVLSGDVSFTADLTTAWSPERRLPVRTRTVGKGSYSGFAFSTDTTSVLRSVTPA